MKLWEALYGRYAFDPREGASGAELCEAIVGPGSIRWVRGAPYDSALVPLAAGDFEVRVRTGLPPERVNGLLAHEALECELRGYIANDVEQLVNSEARAALMPAPAFRIALEEHDGDLVPIAERFCVQTPHAVLRLGEFGVAAVAVILGPRLATRGPRGRLPSGPELRALAREAQALEHGTWVRGMEIVQLCDAGGVALVRWPQTA